MAQAAAAGRELVLGTGKAIFLDRDGVLNQEMGDYVYSLDRCHIPPGAHQALQDLKQAGYYLIVVTNQSGISKGLYRKADMQLIHDHLQACYGGLIDYFYHAPAGDAYGRSLLRKPDSLMLEKGIARFKLDSRQCWLVGDAIRDLEAAAKLNIPSVLIRGMKAESSPIASAVVDDLPGAAQFILSQK